MRYLSLAFIPPPPEEPEQEAPEDPFAEEPRGEAPLPGRPLVVGAGPAGRVIARGGPKPTLIEWDNDVPDWPVLAAEAGRAAAVLGGVPA